MIYFQILKTVTPLNHTILALPTIISSTCSPADIHKIVSLVMCPVILIFTPLPLPIPTFSTEKTYQHPRSLSTFHWTDISPSGCCFTSISSKLLQQHSNNIIISCTILLFNNLYFYVSAVSFSIHVTAMLLPYGCDIQSSILQFKLFHFIPQALGIYTKVFQLGLHFS